MGEVYRADDLKLGQTVALKFLPRGAEYDADRRERFLTEVRMSLRVTHPNVCRVFDLGQVDDRQFLSMEYVDGEDLASLLRRIGRLPEDKAIEIARQLCAGLATGKGPGRCRPPRTSAWSVRSIRRSRCRKWPACDWHQRAS